MRTVIIVIVAAACSADYIATSVFGDPACSAVYSSSAELDGCVPNTRTGPAIANFIRIACSNSSAGMLQQFNDSACTVPTGTPFATALPVATCSPAGTPTTGPR